MKSSHVFEHFGGIANTARALCITYQAARDWPEEVPALRQLHVEKLTNDPASPYYAPGKFHAADDVFERISKRHSKPKLNGSKKRSAARR